MGQVLPRDWLAVAGIYAAVREPLEVGRLRPCGRTRARIRRDAAHPFEARLARGDQRAAPLDEPPHTGSLTLGHCAEIGQNRPREGVACVFDVVGVDRKSGGWRDRAGEG